jgi:hypothetical protein
MVELPDEKAVKILSDALSEYFGNHTDFPTIYGMHPVMTNGIWSDVVAAVQPLALRPADDGRRRDGRRHLMGRRSRCPIVAIVDVGRPVPAIERATRRGEERFAGAHGFASRARSAHPTVART